MPVSNPALPTDQRFVEQKLSQLRDRGLQVTRRMAGTL